LTTPTINVFCERCGTRTVPEKASTGKLGGLAERARAAAGLSGRSPETNLSLCLGCRGYVCAPCLNDSAGLCLDCAPPEIGAVPAPFWEQIDLTPIVVVAEEPEPVVAEEPEPVVAEEPEPVVAEGPPVPETVELSPPTAATADRPPLRLVTPGPVRPPRSAHPSPVPTALPPATPTRHAGAGQRATQFVQLAPPSDTDDLFAGLNVVEPPAVASSAAVEGETSAVTPLADTPVVDTIRDAPEIDPRQPVAATVAPAPMADHAPPAAALSQVELPKTTIARPSDMVNERPRILPPPFRLQNAPRPQAASAQAAAFGEQQLPAARACHHCDLPISIRAAFCRRCGSAQPRVA
jgi:ribosomal protein L40E